MSGRERAEALVAELGRLVGLADVALDTNGYCCLSFDTHLLVNIEHDADNGSLVLYSYLGVPNGDRLKAYEALLDANFFWKGTGGATLSLERETGGIVLLDRVSLERTEIAGFQAALGHFVNMVEDWRDRLAGWAHEDPPPAPPDHHHHFGLLRV
jgi:hypothetical protein